MFILAVDGQDKRVGVINKKILRMLEEHFGEQIWDHVVIVVTKWGQADSDKNKRKRIKITEQGKQEEIINLLNAGFAKSTSRTLRVYFSDTLEINEDLSDYTSKAFRSIRKYGCSLGLMDIAHYPSSI